MRDIFEAIDGYAKAYKQLEDIQRAQPIALPRGDQKTGVIAEFYGRLYAASRFKPITLQFGTTSEHAWDIKVPQENAADLKIQIKAVSAHSDKSRISPIHPGWDELWLMRLDVSLLPEAFWIFKCSDCAWAAKPRASMTMPKRGKSNTGSAELRSGVDKLDELWAAVVTANPSLERTSTGLALGPRDGSGHHPSRGPSTNPVASAQLKP